MSWREVVYYLPWEHYVVDSSEVQGVRVCASSDIFGQSSSLEVTSIEMPYGSGLLNIEVDSLLSVMVLVIMVLYCYMLYRYSSIMRISAKNIVSISSTVAVFSLAKKEFLRYVSLGELICMVSLSAVLSKYSEGIVGFNELYSFVVAFLLCGVVRMWGVVWQRLFSNFDYRAERWRDLRNLTRFDFAILSVVVAPLVVVSLPVGMDSSFVLIGGAVVYLYHFLRIVGYFKSVRFSFLQSFLYLCAVEIVPIALLWGVATHIIVL